MILANEESIESDVSCAYHQAMYNIRDAQKHFEKLLREARRGKEVILARRNTPVAKLVALPEKTDKKATSRST